ncbi:MAG: L,D-transpeptidase [Anaerolineales bacterium]
MNRKIIAILILAVLAGVWVFDPVAAAGDSLDWEIICLDTRYILRDWSCLESFVEPPVEKYPSRSSLNESLYSGASSFPGKRPDPDLASLPYHYLEVKDVRVPLYSTLEDAVAGKNSPRRLIPGFDYVSFTNQVKVKEKWYYWLSSQFWMPGDKAAYFGSISTFQGLIFPKPPEKEFGWVLAEVESQDSPGSQAPVSTGISYQRYDVVVVLETQKEDGVDYLRIGEGEWLPAHRVGRVTVQENPPPDVEGERWIDINLAQQTLAVYEDGELIFATLVATGMEGNWTRPGTFQIDTKKTTELMRGSFTADRSDYYYLEDVPWTMYFDQQRAMHGTYWHDDFGKHQSRGCVNLSPGDAHWVFEWAEEGDWVHVYDPSGETPVDPDQYHSGGA